VTVILGNNEKELLFDDYPPPWTEETLENFSEELGIFYKSSYFQEHTQDFYDEFYIVNEKKWFVAKLKYGI
jgi:hypothetical protein